jgi:hypothetical protein
MNVIITEYYPKPLSSNHMDNFYMLFLNVIVKNFFQLL